MWIKQGADNYFGDLFWVDESGKWEQQVVGLLWEKKMYLVVCLHFEVIVYIWVWRSRSEEG